VDVSNDGFVKIFANFSKFKTDTDDIEKVLMGWIKRIMINVSIDELRKNNMTPEIGGIPEWVWDVPDNSQDASQLLLYKDLIILIKELRPAYRAVFNLYVIDGYTHSEIADLLKIAIGTSKSNLSKARIILQKNIKKMEEDKLCRI
jgi:RNA polymerase sigma-70 factor (ECF subfamily)